MLDIKLFRSNPEAVIDSLRKRGAAAAPVEAVLDLDKEKRELLAESESLKNRRNVVSEEIAAAKKAGEDSQEKILEMREVSQTIKELDERLRQVDEKIHEYLIGIPNLLHESVPQGDSDADNPVVRDGAAPLPWFLSLRPTGTSAKSLICWTLRGAARFPAPVYLL